MKIIFTISTLVLLTTPTQTTASDPPSSSSSTSTGVESTPEELPTPQAYRGGYYNPRPSYKPPHEPYEFIRRSGGGVGMNRDRDVSRNSYVDEDIYSRDEEYPSDNTMLEDKLKHLLRERDMDLEASPSAYQNNIDRDGGHGGGGGGYGLTCTTGYINASAVALLAFLFLLNIIQDVITQITGRRRKRDSEDDFDSSPMDQFVGFGGVDALKEDGPTLLLDLMVKLSDSSEPKCILRPLCDSNFELVDKYGVAGRVIGTLMSNIVSQAYSGGRTEIFDGAQAAAETGRLGSCDSVPICHHKEKKQNKFKWDKWDEN